MLEYNAKDQTTKATTTAAGEPSANVIEYLGPNQIDRVKADGTSFKPSALGLRRQSPSPDTSQPVYFTRDDKGDLIGARRPGFVDYYYLFTEDRWAFPQATAFKHHTHRSSKPAGRGNPTLGRFDSFAAP